MDKKLESNVFKTALLFEGGSLRAAYTCSVVVWLLEQGIYFDKVYGVSAGSSNTVNYLSRDAYRAKASFTTFMEDPKVGDAKTLLQHKGLFNAHYIYQESGLPDGILPFDFKTFHDNPADCCIVSFDQDTGENLFFTKKDMPSIEDVMVRVRASSTLPAFMPPPKIQGRVCYDGGFAIGGGLPLKKIEADGYERVFVVRTRQRGYRKADKGDWAKAFFWQRPMMREAMLTRSQRYNEACDLLDKWEKEGRAQVFYCDDLTLKGTERDVELLTSNYDAGYAQIQRDGADVLRFIELNER